MLGTVLRERIFGFGLLWLMVHLSLILAIGIIGLFLWRSLPKSEVNYTDDYCVYQVLDNHVASKKYTYTIESYNSYCRSHLARLARGTKVVNRSERMVDYSLALLNVMYPVIQGRGLP